MTMSLSRKASLAAVLALSLAPPAAPRTDSLPPIPNIAGLALTVTGPVEPSRLGQTLMHEHIFVDFKFSGSLRPEPATDAELSLQPVTLANLHKARAGHWIADNDFLGDFEESLAEVLEFKAAGGGTIVDVSGIRLGRDPVGLFRISNASGLNIVMGGSWYQKKYHPPNFSDLTLDELTAGMVRDIAVGVDGTEIRSGIIGEIGINGDPLTANELKLVRASARASRLTGAPMTFHVGGVGEEKFRVLKIVADEGVAMSSVVMGHSNGLAFDFPFARRILALGVFIEFDWLGALGSPGGFLEARTNRKVAEGIARLVREGYAGQIVLSHDICNKIQLKKFGGLGYTYIHEYFLPVLRELGVGEADIRKMMVENPARALAFAEPKPLVGGGSPR
ncbi:MAG TPA: aryldialkylphosphatase [Candidatus Aminicenantes bacterium]|nr:aryldialkylphosphatase [Candidatus Aminicenantes bacterium]